MLRTCNRAKKQISFPLYNAPCLCCLPYNCSLDCEQLPLASCLCQFPSNISRLLSFSTVLEGVFGGMVKTNPLFPALDEKRAQKLIIAHLQSKRPRLGEAPASDRDDPRWLGCVGSPCGYVQFTSCSQDAASNFVAPSITHERSKRAGSE